MLVFCPHCTTGYGSSDRLPPLCPKCDRLVLGKDWLHSDPTPKVKLEITRRDWFLLRLFGIDPGRPQP